MDVVVDSSTLISLAWSGSLWLIASCPVDLRVPVPVYDEVVTAGIAGGHVDARAIESSIKDLPRIDVTSVISVDAAVLQAGARVGALVCNDIALGRRAANLGAFWLRTADLIVLSVAAGAISTERGRQVVEALLDTGRITEELTQDYLKELL